jgi:serine O-acetyltransferase
MGDTAVSATAPDWGRERVRNSWDCGRQLLRSIRAYQRWKARGGLLGWLFSRYHVLRHRVWTVISGGDIPVNARLGGGLLLPHPNGVVIHPDAVIGPNCVILQQVTIGVGGKTDAVPTLGGDVTVGAGAKVLGGVVIGDHARIGANAVVLCDVPAGATAVGVPARILQPRLPEPDS